MSALFHELYDSHSHIAGAQGLTNIFKNYPVLLRSKVVKLVGMKIATQQEDVLCHLVLGNKFSKPTAKVFRAIHFNMALSARRNCLQLKDVSFSAKNKD
jgi:hypothetical protein